MFKSKWGLIGLCASIVGFLASLIGGVVSDHKMDEKIEAAVAKRLSN